METSEEQKFRRFLDQEGLRFTTERKLVLREVFRNHNHFEAEDISLELRKSHDGRVSRASVYRTLPLLVKSGLLREVHSNEKHSHYEHVFGHDHHDHLICTECGNTIEFADDDLELLQSKVCERYGFSPASHELEIIGTCKDCLNANNSKATR